MQERQPLNALDKEKIYSEEKKAFLDRSDAEIGRIRDKENRGLISKAEAEGNIISVIISLRTAMNDLNRKYYPTTKRRNAAFENSKTKSPENNTPIKPSNSEQAAILGDQSEEAQRKILEEYIELLRKQLGDSK